MMLLALLLACGGDTPEVAPLEGPPCADGAPAGLDREIEVVRFRGPGVSEAEVDDAVAAMAAFWARHDLELRPVGRVRQVSLPAALGGSESEIDAALGRHGVDPDAPAREVDEAVYRRVAQETMLGPVRSFFEAHAIPPVEDRVIVVVLPEVAAPGTAATRVLSRLDGLTLSPTVDDELGLVGLLGFDSFVPTVLLSARARRSPRPGTLDLTPAHELGHALGLGHTADPADLMSPGDKRCVPGLSAEAVGRLTAPRAAR